MYTSESGKMDHTTTSGAEEGKIELLVSREDEKALVRKIDMHLLPLMFLTYLLQFLDKTALGYTAILGVIKDNHLIGSDFSWVSSAFYFGYLIASYPASFGFVKFPLGKYLSVTVAIWAVVLACHGAASNMVSLTILRVLLGIFESSISPGLSLITGIWYKPSEHASRHGVWFAGNAIASVFGGLLAYAIGHIHNSVAPWRWIFIIFGIATFAWSIVLMLFLPDSPLTANFLEPSQQEYAFRRSQKDQHSYKSKEWKKKQFIEAITDPKTWLIFIATFCTSVPNGGLTSFGSIIVSGFGFTTFDTLLLSIPGSAFVVLFVLSSAYLANKIRRSRCIIMISLLIIGIIGTMMIKEVPRSQRWARLAGLWLFGAYSATLPLMLSIIASDVAGYTKKTTVNAAFFIAYCAGNIGGPLMFYAKEAPAYQSAFTAILVCMCIGIVDIILLRQYMDWENCRRDRAQGVKIDPEARDLSHSATSEEHILRINMDETDGVNLQFRFHL